MRILYAFHGDDWGAVQRAKILIPLLREYFNVEVLQYGREENLHFNEVVHFRIEKRKYNQFFRKFGAVLSIPTYEYAAVVTDNEPNSAWSALIHATPCIQIKTPLTKLYRQNSNILEKIWMRIKKEHYCPANEQIDLCLSLDISSEKKILKALSEEFCHLEKQNHYTVYLPEYDEKTISQVLFQFDVEWHVFTSLPYSYRIQNIWFRSFESKTFELSLKSAIGVMTDLNFQICLNTISNDSKLLVIPNKWQKKEKRIIDNLKTFKIPILDSLDLVHFRSIRNWLEKKTEYHFEVISENSRVIEQINCFVLIHQPKISIAKYTWKLKFLW